MKPKVGIFGLTGCAGDQLVIINCEDELLELVELIDIKSFIMASSQEDQGCALDVALVEGAVVTERDEELLRQVRARSRLLVALGTCATWGGIAATPGGRDWSVMMQDVYGDAAHDYAAHGPRALNEVVEVDAAIVGCPIEKHEFLSAIGNLLQGQLPVFPQYPVCAECKAHENTCLLMDRGAFCCGPLTIAGCDARCPSLGVACIGCRGPSPEANYAHAIEVYLEKGYDAGDIERRLTAFARTHVRAALAGGAA